MLSRDVLRAAFRRRLAGCMMLNVLFALVALEASALFSRGRVSLRAGCAFAALHAAQVALEHAFALAGHSLRARGPAELARDAAALSAADGAGALALAACALARTISLPDDEGLDACASPAKAEDAAARAAALAALLYGLARGAWRGVRVPTRESARAACRRRAFRE